MSGFKWQVNDDLLYEGSDGREAFCIFANGEVGIVTDIHGQGQPFTCVMFSAEHLRELADIVDRRNQESER